MENNGIVWQSLLVFGHLPKFPYRSIIIPSQLERFSAVKLGRTEMESMVEESRIQILLKLKTPHPANNSILPQDLVREHREKTYKLKENSQLRKYSRK